MRWRLQLYCLILSVIVLMFTSKVIEEMATTATQCGCQRRVARGVTIKYLIITITFKCQVCQKQHVALMRGGEEAARR